MSYAMSSPLQAAIYDTLVNDAALTALVGTDIYDEVPSGAVPDLYVRLGSETVQDATDVTGAGAVHKVTVSVISTEPGFASAKDVAGAVSDALHLASMTLSRGILVSLLFEKATAARIDTVSARQIDMLFRARVQDD